MWGWGQSYDIVIKTTGVFNYNNDLLVEMRLLYGSRKAFMGGIPITNFLEDTLDPLRSDRRWTKSRQTWPRGEFSRRTQATAHREFEGEEANDCRR